jgi:N-acetylmuramoyl-L-alanine amidase CwlA
MNFDTLDADVNKILTKHFTKGREGKSIDKVVIHYNDGDLSVQGCYDTWQTRAASAHYQVQSDGVIGQLVWDSNTAWHCGNWNANTTSIGVEHANKSNPVRVTDQCLDSGAHLVAALCKYYKLGRPEWLKNVFPHSYFVSTSCPGSLQSDQKEAYMKKAQEYYDKMTGTASSSTSTTSSTTSTAKASVDTVAQQVINGQWGNGDERKKKLEAAGYNYTEVQNKVNQLLSGNTSSTKLSIDEVAKQVINGKWGNGDDRKKRLTAAGYDYSAVQKRVNQLLG